MELDDLRRSWQQAAADSPAALDAAGLDQLLKRSAQNSVNKMRRNAWLELGFTVICLLLSCGALLCVERLQQRITLIWFIILCFVSIVSYHRHLLKGLRGLHDADATVREQVARQLSSLRGVMRFSYQSALWSLPVSLGIGFFFSLSRIVATYAGRMLLGSLGILVVGTGIAGLFAYFMMRWFARRYLHDLYGQHLDRLEANLRELSEDADAPPDPADGATSGPR